MYYKVHNHCILSIVYQLNNLDRKTFFSTKPDVPTFPLNIRISLCFCVRVNKKRESIFHIYIYASI